MARLLGIKYAIVVTGAQCVTRLDELNSQVGTPGIIFLTSVKAVESRGGDTARGPGTAGSERLGQQQHALLGYGTALP